MMTGGEIALVITSIGTLITSIGSVLVSLRNGQKLNEVHRTTNSLAQRNESIAKQLGVNEGRAAEKANPT
jgi:uncharacterized membrane protein